MKPEEYQLIDKYINNELSAEARHSFEQRLEAEPEFASVVKTYAEINQSLQAKSDRQEQERKLHHLLDDISENYFDSGKKHTPTISMRSIYWAAAASILLIVSFIFLINQPPAVPAYHDYAHYDPLVLTSRGKTNNNLSTAATRAFNQQHYKEAAQILGQLVKEQPENTQLKVYWALSLLETEKYTLADSTLAAIEQGRSVYAHTATWYLALSFLKQGKLKACKIQLEKITKNDYKYEEARELLKKL